jgi:hypothetical protein
MKTLNIGKKRKEIGYLIRRDIKQSYVDKIQKQHNMPFIASGPEYLYPRVPRILAACSIRMGWEYLTEAVKAMVEHIDDCRANGFDAEEKFDYKVVKITVTEEDVQ